MQSLSFLRAILDTVGIVVVTYVLFNAATFLAFHFIPTSNSLKRYQRNSQAWALVTGATKGIGFGHAQELAKRGFNVIILAHKQDEVDEAAEAIMAENMAIKVKKVVLDATKATYTDLHRALLPLLHLPITVLVNNVAVQTSNRTFTEFQSYTSDDIRASIITNALFTCNITHILHETLKRNSPSLVLNVSSGAHSIGLPWLTVYSGTKAFVESWSKAMSREAHMDKADIDSISIIPGDVRTPGNRYGGHHASPDGRQFAVMALDRVGRAKAWGRLVYIPFWKHDIAMFLMRWLPEAIVIPAAIEDIANRRREEMRSE